jgi:hypothetical protein
MISVKTVESRTDWREFLRFPWRIYRDCRAWVPPLLSQQKKQLRPGSGMFFNDGAGSTARYFLAYRDGEVAGRIAAIANEKHRKTHRDGVGFFGFFESIDDVSVAAALLAEAESWLLSRGFFLSRGPTSFTIYDPAGVTVFGNEVRPGVGMAHTPPYYARLLESQGYRKIRDLLAYRIDSDHANTAVLQSIVASFAGDGDGDSIRCLRAHDRFDAEIVAGIFNRAWVRNWGAIPMTADDFLHIQKELGPIADGRLAYLFSRQGEPVAFFAAALDPGEILQGMNGRVDARGLFALMFRRNRIRQGRVFMMGVLPEHRNGPAIGRLLFEFFRHRAEFPALESLELSWILEDNRPMRTLIENIGGVHSHTFRIFERFL